MVSWRGGAKSEYAGYTDLGGKSVRVRLRGEGFMSAALEGDLKQMLREELRDAGGAVRSGVRLTMRNMKRTMDRQMKAAGVKMFKRGRSEWWIAVLFNSKSDGGLNTEGKVYSGFGRAARGFEDGANFGAKKGSFLFIPNPIYRKNLFASGRSLSTIRDNLSIVPSKKEGTLLVFVRGGGKSSKDSLLLGWLVRQVRVRKRIEFAQASEQHLQLLLENILTEWSRRQGSSTLKITG